MQLLIQIDRIKIWWMKSNLVVSRWISFSLIRMFQHIFCSRNEYAASFMNYDNFGSIYFLFPLPIFINFIIKEKKRNWKRKCVCITHLKNFAEMEDEFMDEIEVLNCFTSEILNLKKKKSWTYSLTQKYNNSSNILNNIKPQNLDIKLYFS